MAGTPVVRQHADIDKGYAWFVLFAVFMNHVIVDGLLFSFGIFKVEFDDFFQKGSAQTTLVGSICSAVCLITAPIASVLVNRFGCRPVAISGSLIATLGFATSAACKTLNTLMITYGVIAGIGLGLLYLPSVVAVTFYFEKRRALATGIAVCGSGVGCFIFAPLGNLLLNHYDWKNGILLVAAITLQGCVFGALLRPLVEKKNKKITEQEQVTVPVIALSVYTGGSADEGEGLEGVGRRNDVFQRLDSINESYNIRRNSLTGSGRLRQQSGTSAGGGGGGGRAVGGEEGEIGGGGVGGSTRTRGLSVSSIRSSEGATRARRTSGTIYPVNPNASEDAAAAGGNPRIGEGFNEGEGKGEKRGGTVWGRRLRIFTRVSGIYLLLDSMFLLPFLCNLIASIGLFVPFFYIVSKAQHLGIEKTLASYLLSVIGIANTVNRIFVGLLADMEHVSALLLHNIGLIGAGLLTILSMFAVNFTLLIIYCILFGLCYAAWMALTSVVLCELLGLDKLTHAFGLLTLARGLSTLIGPPLAGAVFDATQNYSNALHVGGTALLLGGLVTSVLHLPYFQRRKYNNDDPDCAFCCPY